MASHAREGGLTVGAEKTTKPCLLLAPHPRLQLAGQLAGPGPSGGSGQASGQPLIWKILELFPHPGHAGLGAGPTPCCCPFLALTAPLGFPTAWMGTGADPWGSMWSPWPPSLCLLCPGAALVLGCKVTTVLSLLPLHVSRLGERVACGRPCRHRRGPESPELGLGWRTDSHSVPVLTLGPGAPPQPGSGARTLSQSLLSTRDNASKVM